MWPSRRCQVSSDACEEVIPIASLYSSDTLILTDSCCSTQIETRSVYGLPSIGAQPMTSFFEFRIVHLFAVNCVKYPECRVVTLREGFHLGQVHEGLIRIQRIWVSQSPCPFLPLLDLRPLLRCSGDRLTKHDTGDGFPGKF